MPFGKYHLFVIREKSGRGRQMRVRGLFVLLGVLLVVGLVAGNVWQWQHRHEGLVPENRLKEAERTIEEQTAHIESLMARIGEVREDLERVRSFDAKLRLMMNMERDPETTSLGGAHGEALVDAFPLHRRHMARRMNAFLRELAGEVRLEEVRQQELLQALRSNREALASIPSIWPVEGFITSRFGGRSDPFTGQGEQHRGLDISAPTGTPVYAPGKGVVVFSGVENGYGNTIVIRHGSGIATRYAHLSRRLVNAGASVARGEIIGHVGSTGRSSGPHLHYEVRLNGVHVDPLRYILN